MIRISKIIFALVFVLILFSYKDEGEKKERLESISVDSLLTIRFQQLLDYPVDSVSFPRSYNTTSNETRKVPSKDWTSGFFPGNLWQLYKLTGNEAFRTKAKAWTAFMEKEKYNNGTHDMGFKIYSSFGEGFEVTQNERYKDVILKSAATLSTRFNKKVRSLRSWDFNKDEWEFPVIIDNMMNLELLFEATKISGDSTYHNIAIKHADTALKNHFREDGSSYHVVVYDTLTGKVKDRVTHQGYSAESAWARGQAWGIYGYTMCYRYTKNPIYLKRAEESATFYLNHPKLLEDGIPYWDFDDPEIPKANRDVSAATVAASALVELTSFTNKKEYLAYAEKVMNTLKSKEYILSPTLNTPFILGHSTGNWPKNDEMDGPIVYGDFYFLELLLRHKN